MKLTLMTTRNVYGNRHYLAIDTDRKVYARDASYWNINDYVTVSAKDLKKTLLNLLDNDYEEVDRI